MVKRARESILPVASCTLAFALVSAVAFSTDTHAQHDEATRAARAKAFGPWDAGNKRAVTRQGREGRKRSAHMFVGDPAKVPGEGPAAPPLRRDVDVPETALEHPNRIGPSLSSNPLWLASLFYSNFLTRVDGPRCHHYPTCSRFASQAVAKHKLMGLFLGLDRILQPPVSSALRGLPTVNTSGQSRSFDPLENYEFWKTEQFTGFPPLVDEQPLELESPPAKPKAGVAAREDQPGATEVSVPGPTTALAVANRD